MPSFSGFGLSGPFSGDRAQNSGIMGHCSGLTVQGSRFRDQGSWLRNQGSEIRVQGSGFRDQGSGVTSTLTVVACLYWIWYSFLFPGSCITWRRWRCSASSSLLSCVCSLTSRLTALRERSGVLLQTQMDVSFHLLLEVPFKLSDSCWGQRQTETCMSNSPGMLTLWERLFRSPEPIRERPVALPLIRSITLYADWSLDPSQTWNLTCVPFTCEQALDRM